MHASIPFYKEIGFNMIDGINSFWSSCENKKLYNPNITLDTERSAWVTEAVNNVIAENPRFISEL